MDQKSVQSHQNRSNFELSFGSCVANEKWYRTGTVAEETGISAYKIRTLVRHGLIESQSNNGMLYIPETAVEHLKQQGARAMPARSVEGRGEVYADDEADEAAVQVVAPRRTTPRNRLTEDLYAEPSVQLAKSKERVIRLEHTIEVKRLQQQSREIDRLAKEERARA